ncbi:hypothetical protein [Pedobacter nototheniae]|uniref:hypothetical protein n=1 Tax=Pedobacter nototheniae TaxID=2488994 RepID=UPI0029306FB2|nr:hypothetical protein [Pedobacter nototheniae]
MKVQQVNKLVKKTAFIYKGAKDQNDFRTDPSTATAKTLLTFDIFDIFDIFFRK